MIISIIVTQNSKHLFFGTGSFQAKSNVWKLLMSSHEWQNTMLFYLLYKLEFSYTFSLCQATLWTIFLFNHINWSCVLFGILQTFTNLCIFQSVTQGHLEKQNLSSPNRSRTWCIICSPGLKHNVHISHFKHCSYHQLSLMPFLIEELLGEY